MKAKLLSILLLIFVFLTAANAQNTLWIRLNPQTGQSAYIADNYLTSPWPNHPDLIAISVNGIQGYEASARSLFKFNLSSLPNNAQIVSAQLSLFANPNPNNPGHGGPNASYIRRVVTHWDKDTVVWEPQPDFTHHNEILLPQLGQGQDIIDLNVRNLVQDMVNSSSGRHGFILMQRFEYVFRSMNFASGICPDTSKRPLLKITYDGVVPVELTSFTSEVNGRNATLRWTTSSEQNNSGFEILQSKNQSDWRKVGFIEGNGNSNTPSNYSFDDRNLSTGRYNYRLKQIDFNGNFEYYDLQGEVVIGVPQKFSLSQNFPNPFNPSTRIYYDIPQDGFVKLKLFDESGRQVQTLVNEVKSAGYYTFDLNGKDLSSGAYFYHLELNASGSDKSFLDSKKMILVK